MISKELEGTLNTALKEAKSRRHEYVCLEHLLYALLQDKDASGAINDRAAGVLVLQQSVKEMLQANVFMTSALRLFQGRT